MVLFSLCSFSLFISSSELQTRCNTEIRVCSRISCGAVGHGCASRLVNSFSYFRDASHFRCPIFDRKHEKPNYVDPKSIIWLQKFLNVVRCFLPLLLSRNYCVENAWPLAATAFSRFLFPASDQITARLQPRSQGLLAGGEKALGG